MELEKSIKNLQEIVELCENEINNKNIDITATLDLEDLKSLQVVLQYIKYDAIPKKEIKELIKEELPDDEICVVCDIYDVNGIEIKQKLQKLLEEDK